MAIGATFSLLLAGCAGGGDEASSDEIKIGVLAPDTGNLSFAMGEAKKAVDQVSKELGLEFGGKTITIVYQGTDGTTSSAQSAVRKLVENDEVDIVLGPGSGDEGLTVVEYALTQPDVTFVNGAASPVDQTLKGADNFFRFMGDSVMWMGGVGRYAYETKGYKNIYLLAEDYSFPYDNAGGFFSEFCAAGGNMTGASWVPVGTTDYATVLSSIPAGTDAVYVGLGGSDAANFLSQAVQAKTPYPLIGGSIAIDPSALGASADIADAAVGMFSGGPVPGAGYTNTLWDKFNSEVEGVNIFTLLYYNAAYALFSGIKAVDGDLGDGQADLRDALKATDFTGPGGHIVLDSNNQAIVDNFITEVVQNADGSLGTVQVAEAHNVKQGTISYQRFDSCP